MAQLGVISFAFMLVIVGAVYAIGHISGGHINPAVTLALAVSGKFPWREVPGYVAAQLVGAIAGAAAIFLTLGRLATVAAGGGVTKYNAATMGFGRASLIEAIGTFMLVFVIFGVIDHRAVPGWAPMAIGAIVFADHHHPRSRDRRGHQPGPLPRHRVHAGAGSGARSPGRRFPRISSANSSAACSAAWPTSSSAGCAPTRQ